MEIILYGITTLAICSWAVVRGGKGRDAIGATLFVGWVYYLCVFGLTTYSLQQAFLAAGDAAQMAFIARAIHKHRLGTIPLVAFASTFTAMLACHLSLFFTSDHSELRYYIALNACYTLQLLTLFGMCVHGAGRRIDSSWHSRFSHSPRHHHSGGNRP